MKPDCMKSDPPPEVIETGLTTGTKWISVLIFATISVTAAALMFELIFRFVPYANQTEPVGGIPSVIPKNQSEPENTLLPSGEENYANDNSPMVLKNVSETDNPLTLPGGTTCRSNFFAIVSDEKVPIVFRSNSPALLGPPLQILGESSTGKMVPIQDPQLRNCLMESPGYDDGLKTGPTRLTIIQSNQKSYIVIKWVCGDSCLPSMERLP